MRTKRAFFRNRAHRNRGSGSVYNNDHAFARRSWNGTLTHYGILHHPKRERSPVELETMRRAALRRPHGFAAAYLAALAMPAPKAPRKRAAAKKVAA